MNLLGKDLVSFCQSREVNDMKALLFIIPVASSNHNINFKWKDLQGTGLTNNINWLNAIPAIVEIHLAVRKLETWSYTFSRFPRTDSSILGRSRSSNVLYRS
jgi:hypothetical protein